MIPSSPVFLGGAACAACALATALRYETHLGSTIAWLGSLALLATAAGRVRTAAQPAREWPAVGPQLDRQAHLLAFWCVVLVAIGFRFLHLPDIPSFVHRDEAMFGFENTWRYHVPHDSREPFVQAPLTWFPYLFGVGWNSFPTLASFLHWTPVLALGPGYASLRVGSAVVGTAAVLATYVWVRRWWGGTAALLAAFLLAVASEHVYWSRQALNNIDATLLVAWTLGSLAWALDTRRPIAWVSLGFSLGFGFHTYHAAKLNLVFAGVVLVLLALPRVRALRRSDLAGLLYALAGFVLVVLPLVPDIVEHASRWSRDHAGRLDLGGLRRALAGAGEGGLAGFFAHHYGPTAELFRTTPWLAALAAIGAGIAAASVRETRHLTLLAWTALAVGVASLAIGWRGARVVTATPLIAVFAALPLVTVLAAAWRVEHSGWVARWLRRAALALVAVVCAVVFGEGYRATFVERLRTGNAIYAWCRLLERVPLPAVVYAAGPLDEVDLANAGRTCGLAVHPDRRIIELRDSESVPGILPDAPTVLVVVGPERDDEVDRLRAREGVIELPFVHRGTVVLRAFWLRSRCPPHTWQDYFDSCSGPPAPDHYHVAPFPG